MAEATLVQDDVRFLETVMGTPLQKSRKGILNNRGKLANRILRESPQAPVAVKDGNTDADLFLTKAFGAPGVMFLAPQETNKSFCLTYFQWGPGMWAQQEEVAE